MYYIYLVHFEIAQTFVHNTVDMNHMYKNKNQTVKTILFINKLIKV